MFDESQLSEMEAGEEVIDENQALHDEWLEKRLGFLTCSEFGCLMGNGRDEEFTKTGMAYLHLKLAERLGSTKFSFTSKPTDWGHQNEPLAIYEYSQREGVEVSSEPYNFVKFNSYVGGTPDGLVGDDGTVQVKCPYNPANHVKTLVTNLVPVEYSWQLQGEMLVTGREWCDFISYDPRIFGPQSLVVIRVDRDQKRVNSLENRLNQAEALLRQWMELKQVRTPSEETADSPAVAMAREHIGLAELDELDKILEDFEFLDSGSPEELEAINGIVKERRAYLESTS